MPNNDVQTPFNVRPETVGRYALGGLAGGAGVAAALNLVHMLKRLSADRKQKDPTETDEGTIVLTLPKRADSPEESGVNDPGVYPGEDYSRIEGDKPEPGDEEEGVQFDDNYPVKSGAKTKEVELSSGTEGVAALDRQIGVTHPIVSMEPIKSAHDALMAMKRAAAPVLEEEGVKHEDLPTDGQLEESPSPEERGVVENKMAPTGRSVSLEQIRRQLMRNTKGQLRHPDGKYGMKTQTKKGNWQTLTASMLAGGAGGALGYRLVDKIYEIKRVKDKEHQLRTAKKEYLDQLQGSGAIKDAAEGHRTFNTLDYPLGLGMLALLLGGGATAYLTKKVLDQQFNGDAAGAPKPPQLRKIVFRAGGEAQKAASAEDSELAHDLFKAALPIYLDICSGEPGVLGDEKVAACLDKCDLEPQDLYKMAASDYNRLLATLEGNPELRRTMQRAAMERHPLLRYFQWAVGLPGLSHIADRKLYENVAHSLGPVPTIKQSFGPDIGQIMSSFYGSELAERAGGKKEEVEEEEKEDPDRAGKLLSQLQIVGEGPDATQFIDNNQDVIKKLLAQLANTGRI